MAITTMHVAMFPWFAMGHFTPFLNLSNMLAERGHRVSFLIPTKVQSKVRELNLHPDLITFIPLVVPHVEGLPLGCETTSDVPVKMGHLVATALDLMQHQIETILHNLKPHFVFYDFAYWIPKLTPSDTKAIYFATAGPSVYLGRYQGEKYPSWMEADLRSCAREFGNGTTLIERTMASFRDCHAICFRACREMEGPYYDSAESTFMKKVLVPGPLLPSPPNFRLEDRWSKWLTEFKERSVVYCALGSETVMSKNQFQELVLGLELTGFPFLAALKVPAGAASMEEALPEGFEDRVNGRGVVHEGWVQQHLILNHPSVGCFISHCGISSMWESLLSDPHIVCLPQILDQNINAKILTSELKVAVEVERRDEDGWFTRENVRKAVESVMNGESEVGRETKVNHAMWKGTLLKEGFESAYMDNFITKLHGMLK